MSMAYNGSSTMKTNPGEDESEKISGVVVEQENHNRKTVRKVYKALHDGETENVAKVVGSELEWRYHGPPNCHHMMKMLTGESTPKDFKFRPRRMSAIGDRVIVEGWEGEGEYWVHVSTLNQGIICQLREHFNTLLTVVVFRVSEDGDQARLWWTTTRVRVQGSLPDLVLSV